MKLKHIKIFLEVAKTLNVTKASKNLYLSQPAVSLAIKELEDEFNVNLFIRSKGRLTLSPEGRILYQKAQAIQSSIDDFTLETTNAIRNNPLHIGSSLSFGTYYLPKLLHNYSSKIVYDVKIEQSNKIIDDIRNGNIDIGFIEDDSILLDMKEFNIFNDRLVIVGTEELLKQYNKQDFMNLPLLVRNESSGTREVLNHELQKMSNSPSLKVISTTNEALKNFALNSIGFAIIPECIVEDELKNKKLYELKISQLSMPRKIRAIVLKSKKINNDLNDFLNYVINKYNK